MEGTILNNVMVDLETLGRRAGCVILSVGAVKFDPRTGFVDMDNTFYKSITIESAMRYGLTIDPDTLRWWMRQTKEAQAVVNDPEAVSIQAALVQFAEWVDEDGNYDDVKMWGNGASFDNPILSAGFAAVDIIQPWQFWNDRCYRTKKAEHREVPFNRVGLAHNALDDAVSQAHHLCAILAAGRTPQSIAAPG